MPLNNELTQDQTKRNIAWFVKKIFKNLPIGAIRLPEVIVYSDDWKNNKRTNYTNADEYYEGYYLPMIRTHAANLMRNKLAPEIMEVYDVDDVNEFKQEVRDSIDARSRRGYYNMHPESFKIQDEHALAQYDEVPFNIYNGGTYGNGSNIMYTCINTATAPYGKKIMRNQDFARNYQKYGYSIIPKEDAQRGDLIQLMGENGNRPHHMVMYQGGIENFPIVLMTESGGNNDPSRYGRGMNTRDRDLSIEPYTFYRYVGTAKDRAASDKLYEEYKNRRQENE